MGWESISNDEENFIFQSTILVSHKYSKCMQLKISMDSKLCSGENSLKICKQNIYIIHIWNLKIVQIETLVFLINILVVMLPQYIWINKIYDFLCLVHKQIYLNYNKIPTVDKFSTINNIEKKSCYMKFSFKFRVLATSCVDMWFFYLQCLMSVYDKYKLFIQK